MPSGHWIIDLVQCAETIRDLAPDELLDIYHSIHARAG
jgi:hypothetical protein